MKIAVLGYSGAGKSTLAKALAEHYSCPILYLDAVNFEADWKLREHEQALSIVSEFLKHESWVIDGNYTQLYQPQRLHDADMIVYMGFSRWTCFLQAWRRHKELAGKARESMANGCNEKFDFEFAKWILFDGRNSKRKAHYRQVLDLYKNKSVMLKNRRQAETFLASLKGASGQAN